MFSARFWSIRVGLGSVFASLLLLLGLFTLTGTASAHITQTLHTHAASTGALIGASCSVGEISTFTFAKSHKHELPKFVCHPYPPNPGCTGGTVSVTFAKSHKKEPPKIVCNLANGASFNMKFLNW